MPPEDTVPPEPSLPPGGDWELPPIEPADQLIGWTPEPALPEAEADAPEPVLSEPVLPEPVLPEPVLPEPVLPEPAQRPAFLPGSSDPPLPSAAAGGEATTWFDVAADWQTDPEPEPAPEHDPFAGVGAPLLAAAQVEEPPSAGVLPVPRRTSVSGGPVSPVRALAGAAVAVAGVLLGIGALLWATDAPKGSPAVPQTQAQSSDLVASPSPSILPSPSPEPTTAAPAPLVSPSAGPSPAAAPKLPLTVLNNSNVNKLAARAAVKYRANGWPIKDTGAFRGRIPVTTVYYAPGQLASAQLLQKEFPAIARVRPRFATLPGSGLTVVLTRDYPA